MIPIEESTLPFLRGEKLDTDLKFRIADPRAPPVADLDVILDRFSLLASLCCGKRVLHLGCCDHLPVISEKRRDGVWLHDHLVASADQCVGIDIDTKAVAYLTEQLSLENIICHDMTQPPLPEQIADEAWDYLVAGEILEHIPSPADFLSRLTRTLSGRVKAIVLTVPNALKWGNHKNARRGLECINSDHRFSFTPYTLAKVVCDSGLIPESFAFCMCEPVEKLRGLRNFWRRRRFTRYPAFRDNVVLTAWFPHVEG
ncbi:MAG: class I SAM-dependent methyltransferase [Pirellulaceae bacterium]